MHIPMTDNIFWIGVNDLETPLFESLWPLPEGISYNSYLIRDEKTALIDAVKRNFADDLITGLEPLRQQGRQVDYLIINHIEPDHSGAITALANLFPNMCIVGNEMTIKFLKGFYPLSNPVQVVKENDTLCLGQHTLRFVLTPMAHWPETMMTYESSTQTLFSGDVFGGFKALPGGIFDDQLDIGSFIPETRRYFSNIVGKYCAPVQKALQKLRPLPLQTVAATHGPVYRKNPQAIVDLYDRWSRQETDAGAVVVFASMYGHTQRMAEAVAAGLASAGIREIQLFDVSRTHHSFILSAVWQQKALVLGSCTYNGKIFPLMEVLLEALEQNGVRGRTAGIFGSYSWSASPLNRLRDLAAKCRFQLVDPVPEACCAPSKEVLADCDKLGRTLAGQILSAQK